MSQSFTNSMATLRFRGTPIITRSITALFKPFHLTPSVGNTYIAAIQSGEAYVEWVSYVEAVEIALGLAASETVEKGLIALAETWNIDPPLLLQVLGDVDADVDFNALYFLATLIQDGHNLCGMEIETSWHSKRGGEGAFGGLTESIGKRFVYEQSTRDTLYFASDVEKANGEDAAIAVIRKHVEKILDGIVDERYRERVTAGVLAVELPAITDEAYATYPKEIWRYEVSEDATNLCYDDWVRQQVDAYECDSDIAA